MKKVKPMPLKQEPIKDLVPEFTETDSLRKLADVAQIKKQIDVVSNQRDAAKSMLSGITEHFETIIEKLAASNVGEVELTNLTEEQVEEYYTMPDGTPITIDIPMKTREEEINFKRDYLSMLVNNRQSFANIDNTLAKLDEAMHEYDEEIRSLHAETNGDIIKFVRGELNKKLEEEDVDPQLVKNIQDVNLAIDHSYNLAPLIEHYKQLNPRNTISDYAHRNEDIYARFIKNCRKNGIVVNYRRFNLIEARFLEERFHKYSEFLPFLVAKMFAYKKDFTRLESIFLLQLNSNLQILFYEKERGLVLNEQQEAERELMVKSIEELLSLFM